MTPGWFTLPGRIIYFSTGPGTFWKWCSTFLQAGYVSSLQGKSCGQYDFWYLRASTQHPQTSHFKFTRKKTSQRHSKGRALIVLTNNLNGCLVGYPLAIWFRCNLEVLRVVSVSVRWFSQFSWRRYIHEYSYEITCLCMCKFMYTYI